MKSNSKQAGSAPVQFADESDFSSLLDKEFKPKTEEARDAVEAAVRTLAEQALVNAATMTDDGRTGVLARGQKMWTTDAGDMALLDLRHCEFAGAGR